MSGVLRTLLDRFARRLRRPARMPTTGAASEDTEPRQLDIVLSELSPDWVHSLESAEPVTDYDVRSLDAPIDPTYPRR